MKGLFALFFLSLLGWLTVYCTVHQYLLPLAAASNKAYVIIHKIVLVQSVKLTERLYYPATSHPSTSNSRGFESG